MLENNKKFQTWAVIPAFNESKYIGDVIKKTLKYVDKIIVVDDCSKDNTYVVSQKNGAFTIKNPINMGAGFSTRIGCDIASLFNADLILTIDADGQHDPEEIPKLKKLLIDKKLDIVFGSRPQDENMPLIKRIGNKGLSLIANILFNVKIKDSQTGYHIFTRKAYKKLRWESNRFGIVSEFVMKVGRHKLKVGEATVKTIYTDKKAGMTKTDAIKSVLSMFKWRLKGW